MAAENDKPAETQPAKKEAASANTFPVERILSKDECHALTGIERHKVVGALRGTKKTEMTIDEVKAAVDKWLATPVKEN